MEWTCHIINQAPQPFLVSYVLFSVTIPASQATAYKTRPIRSDLSFSRALSCLKRPEPLEQYPHEVYHVMVKVHQNLTSLNKMFSTVLRFLTQLQMEFPLNTPIFHRCVLNGQCLMMKMSSRNKDLERPKV